MIVDALLLLAVVPGPALLPLLVPTPRLRLPPRPRSGDRHRIFRLVSVVAA